MTRILIAVANVKDSYLLKFVINDLYFVISALIMHFCEYPGEFASVQFYRRW